MGGVEGGFEKLDGASLLAEGLIGTGEGHGGENPGLGWALGVGGGEGLFPGGGGFGKGSPGEGRAGAFLE